jgi:hypothetical protein
MNEEPRPELREIDALLRSAARAFAYPAPPPLAAAVRPRIATKGPRRIEWRAALGPALAVLVVAAVALGALLAVPQSREALADFFGLSRVRIETVSPGPTPPALSPDSFARPVMADEAQAAVDFELRYPARDGEPLNADATYVYGERGGAPVVILVYDAFDLYQTRLANFNKEIDYSAPVEEVEVAGQPAVWIETGGHIASFVDGEGRLVVETRRSVDRATLLWEREGLTFRLETSLSLEEAIAVAESLRVAER